MRDLINQREIWIFMGSVSAINGLICFGLSSTYKMLFGKWGFSGLVVYLFVNLMMWCVILWGKRIGVSERYQGPVKALIFVVICSISVLLDKLVPGKSDAWSIISYASFALMSLFTSTKSELGFETGFFSFCLSLFVEQLCKTNLKLSPIAVVFCVLVLIFRHFLALDSGDDDESQDSQGMGEVAEQSLLPAYDQQNNQEEPSQASQDDRVMGEVSGQSLSSTTIQQNHNQEQPSQAQNNEDEENRPLLPDTLTGEVPPQDSTSNRSTEQNNERAEEDTPSLPAESQDQDQESRDLERVPSGNNDVTIQIGETHPVPELRRRRRRWMPPGIPNVSSRVGHSLGQLQRQVAPHSLNFLFFFLK